MDIETFSGRKMNKGLLRRLLYAIKHPMFTLQIREINRNVRLSPRNRVDEYEKLAGINEGICKLSGLPIGKLRGNETFDKSFNALGSRRPPNALDISEGKILYTLLRIVKPEVVVETGVGKGFSSTFILEALEDNQRGHLYSIDIGIDIDLGGSTIGDLIPIRLRHRWSFIEGLSSKRLKPLLARLDQVDFFFHDSEHSYKNMIYELRTVYPTLKDEGILLSHNANLNDAFLNFCDEVKHNPIIMKTPFFLSGIRK